MIAPCGIDCAQCPINSASNNHTSSQESPQEEIIRRTSNKDLRWFRCAGCREISSRVWTKDCRIRRCCLDEKQLNSCSECPEFPCSMLLQWASEYDYHTKALNYLYRTSITGKHQTEQP